MSKNEITRRSSHELNVEKNRDREESHSSDLSRSESMRNGAFIAGYRAFREGDFIEKEILGEGFFASARKVFKSDFEKTIVLHSYKINIVRFQKLWRFFRENATFPIIMARAKFSK